MNVFVHIDTHIHVYDTYLFVYTSDSNAPKGCALHYCQYPQ
jgi:hypothetical protein